jgi:hypothetical protein
MVSLCGMIVQMIPLAIAVIIEYLRTFLYFAVFFISIHKEKPEMKAIGKEIMKSIPKMFLMIASR